MKRAASVKRLLGAVIAVLVSLFIVFMAGAEPVLFAYAADLTLYDRTQIEDDLKDVDLRPYGKNEAGMHRLLDDVGFMEYGYSMTASIAKKYYGVYFYVYNPTEKAVSSRAGANVVNMAIEYDAEGNPTKYANLSLTMLDKTENNRIYKFRLTNGDGAYERAGAYAEKHGGERRYDVGSIQLWFAGENDPTDSYAGVGKDGTDGVAYTYYCSGFSKGCGADTEAESTLETRKEELKALRLDVHHTYFRPGKNDGENNYYASNGKDQFTRDSLTSIYFSVPKEIVDTYGEMSRIRGQYLKALTNDIFVTGNAEYYKLLEQQLGKNMGFSGDENNVTIVAKGLREFKIRPLTFLTVNPIAGILLSGTEKDFWGYNYPADSREKVQKLIEEEDFHYFNSLYYLFYAEGGKAENYDVSSDSIVKYMEDYTKDHPVPEEALVGGFSPDLFAWVDDGMTQFDISDRDFTQPLKEVKIKQDWWHKLWGTTKEVESREYEGKEAIHKVRDSDFVYSSGNKVDAAQTSDSLYIAESDVEKFYNYYLENKDDSYVYLIRFAVDDYVSCQAYQTHCKKDSAWEDFCTWLTGKNLIMEGKDDNGYLAQEYVYLDFEIIDLSFTKEGVTTVIPVVMSPIDIVSDITHPVHWEETVTKKILWYMIGISVASLTGGIISTVVEVKRVRK